MDHITIQRLRNGRYSVRIYHQAEGGGGYRAEFFDRWAEVIAYLEFLVRE